MSILLLVRHAQASFFDDDYDQLSDLGMIQSQRLGDYFVSRGETFDEVYTGPARRHQQTAEIVGNCFKKEGLGWKEPIVIDGLDEHHADRLLKLAADEICTEHPRLAPLFENHRAATEPGDVQKSFQLLFEAVTNLWTEGRIVSPHVETWPDFQRRVREATTEMTENKPAGSRVLAFSSVGPITAVLQSVLGMADAGALQLGWRLRNCALSGFIFSANRITLDSFNSMSHLDNPELITYR